MIVSRLRVDPPGCDLCSARGDVLVQGDRSPIALCWLCARKLLDHLDAFVTDEDKPRRVWRTGCARAVEPSGECTCGTCAVEAS